MRFPQFSPLGLALAAFAFLAAAMPAGAQNAARAPALQRTTLIVNDIDKSIDFYQRIGLTKTSDTRSTDKDEGGVYGAAVLPLTADSKNSRLVVMRGDERTGTIALLWYDRPQLPSARGNLAGVGTGDVIVVIEVADAQGAFSRLNQIGTRFHVPLGRFTATGNDGAPQSGQHLVAYDPDGHVVEVAQLDAAKK
jgi:catechol 2,3-dioxygenase-like lactoylglutathione lyase family enzyme